MAEVRPEQAVEIADGAPRQEVRFRRWNRAPADPDVKARRE
jgi:hypothetical protein